IAARGIDVDGVSHVVNFELPFVPEAYVHRIGRTARAGADGTAISFVAGDEMKLLKDIEKVTRQKIPAIDRRNDKQLAQLDASILAAGVGKKATLPEREGGERAEGRGPRRGGRHGVKPTGAKGQPHRNRGGERARNGAQPARPAFDPLKGERAPVAANDEARPAGAAFKRRRRRPSNGGKGYAAQA